MKLNVYNIDYRDIIMSEKSINNIMNEKEFMDDLNKVYEISNELNSKLNLYYKCFDKGADFDSSDNVKMRNFIDSFLDSIEFEKTAQNRLSIIRKLVLLKSDYLISAIEDKKLDSGSKKEILSSAYTWAGSYHVGIFEELIFEMENENLLTPFYRELIKGVKSIGLSFTQLDVSWESVITEINSILLNKFNNKTEKTVEFIHKNNLMDKLPEGSKADRCYSILVEDDNADCGFSTQSYGEFFEVEVDEICSKLYDLNLVLEELSDDVFNMKENWINYFNSLIDAFSERDCDKLIEMWRKVDFEWMKVRSPIQVVHCMEYYNDNIRNCVEIEWDLRLVNPARNDASAVMDSVKSMYNSYMNENDLKNKNDNKNVYDVSISALENVQLYVGKPLMYFGKFFNGLFSAQVIPNDEVVSAQTGKKVFAFADFVLENEKAAPAMKLSNQVFGSDFVAELKDIACNKPDVWHNNYSITTVGHELGHILWKGTDTEIVMNGSGNFKNIEEYKATTGGLVAFFKSDDVDKYWKELFYDFVERAIKLVAWKKTGPVVPYYCEGLIHLTGLFETGVLKFDKENEKLDINMSRESFDNMSKWIIKNYENLFSVYLDKKDANEFLSVFAKKGNDGYFMPVDSVTCEFAVWYYELYEKNGRETLD